MKNILLALLCVGVFTSSSFGQGCVAVRHMSCSVGTGANSNSMMHPGQWQVSLGFRSLHSYKHYVGADYQPAREAAGTNVINDQQGFDLGVTYSITDRLSMAVNLPLNFNYRTSLYEHYGNAVAGNPLQKRFGTMANGIGDARITASYWLLDPLKHMKGNLSVGLGVKLPTGDWNVQDQFHRRATDGSDYTITKAVDQSIQLGDGGTGFTVELNTFYNFKHNFGVYGNLYYLMNPREQNGTRTYRETLSPFLANEAIMSVPDQYMLRGGFNYSFNHIKGLSVAAGARLEGIPVHDLVGGSGDFRRPGYIWSVEPSVNYEYKKVTLFASVPFAVVRNRTQSVTDKESICGP